MLGAWSAVTIPDGESWPVPPTEAAQHAKGDLMAIGPVQLLVLGFNHPNFHGEIIQELERLRDSDTIRVIDALAVTKTPRARSR
jgi:hypothetical protein